MDPVDTTKTVEPVLEDKMQKYDETIRLLLGKMPVDAILKFRERTKALHNRQLKLINEVLSTRGYVETHHEGMLSHTRE